MKAWFRFWKKNGDVFQTNRVRLHGFTHKAAQKPRRIRAALKPPG